MKNYSKYSVEDFAADLDFINWVISPNASSDNFWNIYIQEHPSQKKDIDEAIFMIHSLQGEEESVSQEKLNKIWNDINSASQKAEKLNLFKYFQWAAIVIVMFTSGILVYKQIQNNKFRFANTRVSKTHDAKLYLADGSVKTLANKESEIEVNHSGEIIVDKDTLNVESQNNVKAKLNYVVMPYGKQTNLQLPDGTSVYVNAGTRLSFPSKFTGSKREVFLEGEALFKVEKNEKKPFIVHTPDVDIIVTGTEFNVSAYPDDNFMQTALVSGSVSVTKNKFLSKKITIKPGESAVFDKNSGEITTEKVNTDNIISWTKGYLIFKGEQAPNVLKKLERFFAKKIDSGEGLEEITFSGKLDLREDLDSVLETISFASSVKISKKEKKKTYYLIKP